MKRLLTLLIVIALPALAHAQGAPPPPPPPGGGGGMGMAPGPASTSPPGSTWIGGGLQLLTAGNVSSSSGGTSQSVDLETAYGFMAVLDYQINDLITLRAMPRYITNIKASGDTQSESAFDLRAGLTVGKEIAPLARLYGVGALGYSSVSFPDQMGMSIPNATGLTITFGAGLTYSLNPTMRFYAEGAYEIGYESLSVMGSSADFNVKYLEIGGGLQFAIGGAH